MGFFDMLKDGAKILTEQVTGSYGDIDFHFEPVEIKRGDRLLYILNIQATGELKAKAVYLRLVSSETCRMTVKVRDFSGHMSPKEFTQSKTLYDNRIEVCGSLEMSTGESREMKGEIGIPTDVQPTYRGFMAQHTWQIEAVLDSPWGKNLTRSKEIVIR